MSSKGDDKWRSRPLSWYDTIAVIWFILDAFTHLTIEQLYVYYTLAHGGAANSSSPWSYMWREYGKADARWAVYDPTVLSLELLTVYVMGPAALLMIYAILTRQPYRHLLQVFICTCELYGGAMTFFPEWLSGNANLSGDPYHVYLYLAFMNLLWVTTPAVLLYDSAVRITQACDVAKTEKKDDAPAGTLAYVFVAITLVVYAVAVPVILANAKA